jgi:hypothetical protein
MEAMDLAQPSLHLDLSTSEIHSNVFTYLAVPQRVGQRDEVALPTS